MRLKSINKHCQDYLEAVVPADASQLQKDGTKRAFISGAWALFSELEEIGRPHVSEKDGAEYLESVRNEFLEFKRRIIKDYAERN